MKDRLRPKQAAKLLGVTVQLLNYQMDMGIWDLGPIAISKTGRHTHVIMKSKLEKYLGREIQEGEL